ncbi:MAG: serine hydrolase domain-containing protein [Thermomicrobium sp.]|nr:beta-lactamase family protein [Thermomicrobium sp.]MDW8059413.1 serine hydrolase domain-containing protein [Thermomicrobium sp.]
MSGTKSLEAVVAEACRTAGVPGMVVGILTEQEREVVVQGVASAETGCPVRRDTLFQIGSISKVYLATLAMRLVEEGKLRLDEPIVAVLPELELADPRASESITLRHLLTHTSGLEGDRFDDHGYGDDALARYVAGLRDARQIHPPGRLWSYCNSGFSLAGRLIEVVTGQPFESAMQERVFQPLGLERTFFFVQDVIGYPYASGHRTDDAGRLEVVRDFALPRSVHPAGGIWATIDDLLTFAAFHLELYRPSPAPLSLDGVRLLRTPQVPAANWADHYGIGWAIWRCGRTTLVGHGGSTNGFQAHLVLVPEQRAAIASLTNHEQGSAAYLEVETRILAERFGIRPDPVRLVTLTEAQLERFAGTYEYPLARLTVRAVAGGLRLETTQRRGLSKVARERQLPPLFLRPSGAREFVVGAPRAVPNRVDFLSEGDDERPRWIRAFGRLAERVDDGVARDRCTAGSG